MRGEGVFNTIGAAFIAFMLVTSPSAVRGSDLCDYQDGIRRDSVCDSVFATRTPVVAAYNFTENNTALVPDWMYDFADPATVTLVSEFHTEILKYSAELFRLSQALQDYQSTPEYLDEKQDDAFKRHVEELNIVLNNADASVEVLKDAVAILVDSALSTTSAALEETSNQTAAVTTPPPSTNYEEYIESITDIKQEASHVTKLLKDLLKRWGQHCYTCADSRKKRSMFVFLTREKMSGQ